MQGVDWVRHFSKRRTSKVRLHPVISTSLKIITNYARLYEEIKRARAQVYSETIKEYFSELEVNRTNVSLEQIINDDETSFHSDPGHQKVLVKRGAARHSERNIESSKT